MALESQTKRPGWGCSLALLILLVAVGAGAVLLAPRALAFLTNAAPVTATGLTDRTSPEQVATYRQAAEAQLNGYGWVDQAANVARIPIARAIALVAEQGLPVGAPVAEVAVEQPATGAATENPTPAAEPTQVDFKRDVLPIFEEHCSNCHGFEEPEEGLVLTGYRSVMQGSNNGPVIVPGDPEKSYLVELVVKGKMPKRGQKLTPEESAVITGWIREGALETAAAQTASGAEPITTTAAIPATAITTSVTAPAATAAPTTTVAAIDPAQVDFKRDVLPIFEQRCSNCHGFEEPEEDLVLTGYRSVMQGSKNGPVIAPGDPEKSYLVEQIVKGKMPKRGKKLTPEEIAIITAWVQGGAREEASTVASITAEVTLTPTVALSATAATVATPTLTDTAPSNVAATSTPTATATMTAVATATATKIARATATLTPKATATATAVATPTVTATVASTATSSAAAAPTVDPATVSFKNDVLPILEDRCSNCHGFEEPEEGLVLTGYRSIIQGSNNGPVIEPGDPEKSYLVELIVEGKMPKRGRKLTAEEIAVIIAWVQGGARED